MRHLHDVWGVADGWQREALIALAVATVAQTFFISIYARRPWFRDRVGRALMWKSSSLTLILWLSLLNTFFIYRWQEQVSTIALNIVAAAILYQLTVLIATPARVPHPEE